MKPRVMAMAPPVELPLVNLEKCHLATEAGIARAVPSPARFEFFVMSVEKSPCVRSPAGIQAPVGSIRSDCLNWQSEVRQSGGHVLGQCPLDPGHGSRLDSFLGKWL